MHDTIIQELKDKIIERNIEIVGIEEKIEKLKSKLHSARYILKKDQQRLKTLEGDRNGV